jgi:hypothetical protein
MHHVLPCRVLQCFLRICSAVETCSTGPAGWLASTVHHVPSTTEAQFFHHSSLPLPSGADEHLMIRHMEKVTQTAAALLSVVYSGVRWCTMVGQDKMKAHVRRAGHTCTADLTSHRKSAEKGKAQRRTKMAGLHSRSLASALRQVGYAGPTVGSCCTFTPPHSTSTNTRQSVKRVHHVG